MYKLYSYLQNNSGILLIAVLTSVIITITSTAHALQDDIEKPVHINADSVLFNKTKGIGVYEGNVSIVQGSLDIRARKIEISAPDGEIKKITATGSPVKFKQKMDDGKLAQGEANSVIYHVDSKRIVLNGNAAITQNNDKFASNHIVYSISDGELQAGDKKAPGKSRVKAVFYPTNKSK